MNGHWFDPNTMAWVPGTALGCLAGVWGALAGSLAPMGKAKRLVTGGGFLLLALALISGVAGLGALVQGQPYGVWYGLLLPSIIGGFVLGPILPMVFLRYRQAEARKMSAEDI